MEAPAREAIGRAPALGEPHYRLGRLYRALQRFDLALEEQEKAVAKEPGYAPARYERALLDLRRWEKRLEELRAAWAREEGRRRAKSGDPERAGAPPPDAELAAGDAEASALRDRIAADLAALPAGAEESCLRGLVELHGGTDAERSDGERRVEQALAADPTLEEGYEGLARAAKARLDFEGAKRHYARGIAADAGYVPFLVGRAEVEAAEAGRAMSLGGDPVPACERAAADLTRALELDPGSWSARLLRGRILALEGDRAGERGTDPEELLGRALADLTAAVEARPRDAAPRLARGSLHATWAYWFAEHALDPSERLALAVADYDAAIALAPLSAEAWGGRGDVRRHDGRFRKNRGEDPREQYDGALADFARALELDPRSVALWTSRAAVREALSVFARVRGDAWRDLLDGARADLGRALELEPRSTWILGSRAQLDLLLAGCLVQDGEEPGDVYRRAIADLDALVAVQASVRALLDRANCRIQWAEHEEALGRGTAELRTAARRDLEAIRVESAGAFEYGIAVGRLEILEARTGDTPTRLQRAIEALDGSIRLNSGATEAWMRRGEAARQLGAWEAAHGMDPRPTWTGAASSFSNALAINSLWEEVWFRRGRLRLEEAAWRAARGEDAVAAFAAALADCEKAVEVNSRSVEGWVLLGEARRRAPGTKPEDALAALDRAVALGPNHPGARLERARARLALGNGAGASEDAAWVAERVPAWRGECDELLRRAEGR